MERTQFIIVRHGQTQWNHRGIRQGHLDSDLTARGIAQAKALGIRLAREHFTTLYSSDLGRAVHTARIIAASTGHEIVTDARLRERHLGIFQGLDGDQIRAKYPEEHRLHRTVGPDYVIPEGESVRQQVARNVAYLTRDCSEAFGRNDRGRDTRRRAQRSLPPHFFNSLRCAAPV